MIGETLVADTILGKYIVDGLDWSYKKIRDIIKQEKEVNSHTNYETMMYQAIINVFCKVSCCKYEDKQDAICQAAEQFVKDWRSKGALDISIPIRSMNRVISKVTDENCEYFIDLLKEEISNNDELRKRFNINNIFETQSNILGLINTCEKSSDKIDNMYEHMFNKSDVASSNEPIIKNKSIFKDNKQEYIDKWNAKLFLQKKDDKRELRLNNTFMMPEYKKNGNRKGDLEHTLTSFFSNDKRTMLILGFPGMGKTSIIAYLANKYQDNDQLLILKFSAINEENLMKGIKLLDFICIELGCTEKDLEKKILILDGFDEIKYSGDTHNLLRIFFLDIKNIDSFKVIITSRVNYINTDSLKVNEIIPLAAFSSEQIREFHKIILDKELSEKVEINNREVLGIPVILYMALMVGIDIQSDGSRTEIYEKIFALEGGIFDRFESEENEAYQKGSHKVEYEKEKFHRILQILAFEMFIKNKEVVDKQDYMELVKSMKDIDEDIIFEFPIKNLYEEGRGIKYVHKSIYEYFVAEYMYQEIKKIIESREVEVAKVLGILLNKSILTDEIKEYLSHKISINISDKNKKKFLEAFSLMLEKGLTFFTEEHYENIIQCEINVFYNVLCILHFSTYSIDSLLCIEDKKDKFSFYLRHLSGEASLNLSYMDLKDINLSGADLRGADMRGVNLSGADLSRINFNGVNLKNANLSKTNLKEVDFTLENMNGVNLNRADLYRAKLAGADLREAKLAGADLREAKLAGADLYRAKLAGADLREANLAGSDLRGANLRGSDLRKAKLMNVQLRAGITYNSELTSLVCKLDSAIFDKENIKIIEKMEPQLILKSKVEFNGKIIPYKEYKKLEKDNKESK